MSRCDLTACVQVDARYHCLPAASHATSIAAIRRRTRSPAEKLSRASVHIDGEIVCDGKVLADLVSRKRISRPSQSIVSALAGFSEARQFAGIPYVRLVSFCRPLHLPNDTCLPSQAQEGYELCILTCTTTDPARRIALSPMQAPALMMHPSPM